jgi:hypothetical protein
MIPDVAQQMALQLLELSRVLLELLIHSRDHVKKMMELVE